MKSLKEVSRKRKYAKCHISGFDCVEFFFQLFFCLFKLALFEKKLSADAVTVNNVFFKKKIPQRIVSHPEYLRRIAQTYEIIGINIIQDGISFSDLIELFYILNYIFHHCKAKLEGRKKRGLWTELR